jgi:hypothetical protein
MTTKANPSDTTRKIAESINNTMKMDTYVYIAIPYKG